MRGLVCSFVRFYQGLDYHVTLPLSRVQLTIIWLAWLQLPDGSGAGKAEPLPGRWHGVDMSVLAPRPRLLIRSDRLRLLLAGVNGRTSLTEIYQSFNRSVGALSCREADAQQRPGLSPALPRAGVALFRAEPAAAPPARPDKRSVGAICGRNPRPLR